MSKTLLTPLTCLAKPQGAVFPQRPPGPARRPALRCFRLLQSGSRVTGFRWLQQSCPSDLVEASAGHVRRSWGPRVRPRALWVRMPISSLGKMRGNAHVRHDASQQALTCTSLVGKKTPSLLLRFSDGGPPLNPAHRQRWKVDAFRFRCVSLCLALLQAVVSSEGRITWCNVNGLYIMRPLLVP